MTSPCMEDLIGDEELYSALDSLARSSMESSGFGALFVDLANKRAKYFSERDVEDVNVKNALVAERLEDETPHVYFVINDGRFVHIFKKPV